MVRCLILSSVAAFSVALTSDTAFAFRSPLANIAYHKRAVRREKIHPKRLGGAAWRREWNACLASPDAYR